MCDYDSDYDSDDAHGDDNDDDGEDGGDRRTAQLGRYGCLVPSRTATQ